MRVIPLIINLILQAAAALFCVYYRDTMSTGLVGVVMVQSFSSIRAFRLTLKTYVDVESKVRRFIVGKAY